MYQRYRRLETVLDTRSRDLGGGRLVESTGLSMGTDGSGGVTPGLPGVPGVPGCESSD